MRRTQPTLAVSCIALLGLGWLGCKAVGGENQEAVESEGAQDTGFLERVFTPDPVSVTVPAGTLIALQLHDTLSSHETQVGTTFSADVTQEISVDGHVAIPVGSTVTGRVTEAHAANKVGGRAILSVSFFELDTPADDPVAISARLAQTGKSEVGKDAAIIGGSTIGGAILGEAIDEGEGGVVGAIVGGIAGTVGAMKTKGKPVVLPAGTALPITLETPITIEVEP